MGKICPRLDPDIAHMKYSIDPPELIYKLLLLLYLTELSAMLCIMTYYQSIPKGIGFWIT